MPLLDLLHFGTGLQAVHYLIFCFVAILGTLQMAATRFNRRDLMWFEGRGGYVVGALIVAASFIWFFLADDEIFTPGLAGGELFLLFIIPFAIAVPLTRLVARVVNRLGWLAPAPTPVPARREEEPSV